MSLRIDLAQLYNLLIHGNTALNGANTPSVQRSQREIASWMSGDMTHRPAFPIRLLFAPANASQTAILNAHPLTSAAHLTTPSAQPDFPRFLQVKSVAGVTGNVTITGTDYSDASISDTIALNGASAVEGVKAFKHITNIAVPVQVHPSAFQQETATAVGTIGTGGGNISVVVTAAGMTGTPKTILVPAVEGDVATVWAGKVRTALTNDAAVSAVFTVSGADDKIILTKKVKAANDATMNIALDNGTTTGVTTAATSEDTTTGYDVGADTVSVGYTNKFGLPHIMAHSGMLIYKNFNGSTDSGAITIHADLCKNIIALAGTPDGSKKVDIMYYL